MSNFFLLQKKIYNKQENNKYKITRKLSTDEKSEFDSILHLCHNQSYFKLNDRYYFQHDSLPMGPPLSPI